MEAGQALCLIEEELDRAQEKFPAPFASWHEGCAIIEEEFLEFRTEVFWGKSADDRQTECVQLAAMALRFLVELC